MEDEKDLIQEEIQEEKDPSQENIEKIVEPEESIENIEEEKEAENLGTMEENLKEGETALDDARRLKVVSPGMLVLKRFFRNKLAIVGLVILVALFAFCFIGSWTYRYKEDDIFTTYKDMYFNYANANYRDNYENYMLVEDPSRDLTFIAAMNTTIVNNMIPGNKTSVDLTNKGKSYTLTKSNDNIYILTYNDKVKYITLSKDVKVASYQNTDVVYESGTTLSTIVKEKLEEIRSTKGTTSYTDTDGNVYTFVGSKFAGDIVCTYGTPVETYRKEGVSDAFVNAAIAHFEDANITFDAVDYNITKDGNTYDITLVSSYPYLVSTTLVFDCYTPGTILSESFKANTLLNVVSGAECVINGKTYKTVEESGKLIVKVKDGTEWDNFANLSTFVVRRYNGEDSLNIQFKEKVADVLADMEANAKYEDFVTIKSEKMVEDEETGELVIALDEHGNPIFDEEEFEVIKKSQTYLFRNVQAKYVADIYASPSKDHPLGLDSNAMDVLARIMYGGRISLVIGFIVVFIEIFLGMILGGISGFFGGFVDNLIMRIVDIFYCIPTMPILIILGAMFDAIGMPNLERVIWMMAVLGFLGWPGIARLVRGQILSLREQDFMIAAEASGLSNRRRIFKHLIPNVTPQLIVQATMGVGSVIITESTLSFLGLGVKFPMATWGQIINSVSSVTDMINYTYIWIPVGCLICLAVIAFNFVGDGLRDAFDPKMKR